MRSFVDENPYICWCPFTRCGRAVKVESSSTKIVRCLCNQEFCFQCMSENHYPASCADVEAWIAKESDEGETVKWMQAHNVKKCPNCKALVEKIDGCMSMVCTKCQFNFCWMCLGPAHGHFFEESGCNRYRPDEAEDSKKQLAMNDIQRYSHYYSRYADHRGAEKFEMDVESSVNKFASSSFADSYGVAFDACSTLLKCRRTLKWSYVYAFFEGNAHARELFEFTQKELEGATERLASALKEACDRPTLAGRASDAEKRRRLLADPESPFHKDLAGFQHLFTGQSDTGGASSSGRGRGSSSNRGPGKQGRRAGRFR